MKKKRRKKLTRLFSDEKQEKVEGRRKNYEGESAKPLNV